MDECSSAGFSARAANLDQELGTRPLAEVQGEVMMRIGPSFSCERKYLIPAGGTVQLHACQGDWCLVSYGTETGYLPVAALDRVPNLAPDGPEE
ncbi:SH3 domain-containing protein [Rhodoligotrophos defluvii]|uniref:SH3 domain-containing protein n=1 Tax=Rhodoligotrophos defluvii TaxID=2561934 RepID=UPI0010C939F5|nr:SH3 domain-containing protein [Rhodoligotrophos defluvii]